MTQPQSQLRVRAAGPEDAAALVALNNQLVSQTDLMVLLPIEPATGTGQLRALLERQAIEGSRLILIADIDGAPVGMAIGTADPNPRYRGVVEMEVGVVQAAWGRGIGRILMQLVERRWTERGARRFQLRVLDRNERGLRLYRSLGYQEEGRLRCNVAMPDGSFADQVLMGKLV
ncbi:MAG TPA: GNAT family N-acetyltransferase [Azospirillaceae bacterium]|nr:GNAT family N-acetyltransferase [Azospirillaceae bacterium]